MNLKNNILFILSFCLAFSQIQSMESRKGKEIYGEEAYVQAHVESKIVKGTVSLIPGQGIALASMYPGSGITIAGGIPDAVIKTGSGFTVGHVHGTGSSSGISQQTGAGDEKYHFIVNLRIPIQFVTTHSSKPVIFVDMEYDNLNVSSLSDANTESTVDPSTSNVSMTSAIVNLTFNIDAAGLNYHSALVNAQTALNNILTDGLSINISATNQI